MIRILFVLIASLLMIATVIGGLYYWGIDPLEFFGLTLPSHEQSEQKKSLSSVPPAYVDFGPMIIPIVQNHEVRKQAEMILRLEVRSDKKDLVANNLPRLQNAFLTDMMEFIPRLLAQDNSTILDNEKISERLLVPAEGVMGEGVVTRILIEQSAIK